MRLIELLKLINRDQFPLVADKFGIDSRPNCVFTITICFMCEEETWETVNIASEILVPWYDCEVNSIQGSDKNDDILVWLEDTEYIKQHWAHHIKWMEKGEQNAVD